MYVWKYNEDDSVISRQRITLDGLKYQCNQTNNLLEPMNKICTQQSNTITAND